MDLTELKKEFSNAVDHLDDVSYAIEDILDSIEKNIVYLLITTYSYDEEVSILPFKTEQGAKDELKRQINEEVRIAVEENGWDPDSLNSKVWADGYCGTLTEDFLDGGYRRDTTEWRVCPICVNDIVQAL